MSASALSQIANHLVLPPGLFVLLLCAALLLVRRAGLQENARALPGRTAALRGVLAAAVLLLYLLSLPPVAAGLLAPLETAYPGRPPASFADGAHDEAAAQAVVVLGGGTVPSSPDEPGGASLSGTSLKRLLFAHRIRRRTGLPLIISGGSPELRRGTLPAEAEIGAALLKSLGAAPTGTLTETESRSTFENAREVAALFSSRRIILVTSAYHMPRSVRTFRSRGFQVFPAPTDYQSERGPLSLGDLLPSMEALHDSYRALHEYAGSVWYELAYY